MTQFNAASPAHVGAPARDADPCDQLNNVQQALATRVFGKPREIRLALTCLLADGHLLIEDVPGVGKTTLAHALAQVLGLSFSRVQFTSDLLPSDILGVSLFDRNTSTFRFQPGPIFAQLILADEVNRASPKTQSALLEAMAERQVTIDGHTHDLPRPFAVIATQNPADHTGTFALPDSQLDRFLMRIGLGYPPPAAEKMLLDTGASETRQTPLPAQIDAVKLANWQRAVANVATSGALLDYLLRLIHYTREEPAFVRGLSPRAGLALRRCAQGWALLAGRDYVLPEDVQAILPAVVDHRLVLSEGRVAPSALLLERVDVG